MDLLWFVLTAYGLTFLIVYANLFDGIRPSKESLRGYGKLFHCPLCMGVWVGWFLFVIITWTELFTFDYTIANFFICGWLSAGTSYILSMVVGDEGIKIDKGTS